MPSQQPLAQVVLLQVPPVHWPPTQCAPGVVEQSLQILPSFPHALSSVALPMQLPATSMHLSSQFAALHAPNAVSQTWLVLHAAHCTAALPQADSVMLRMQMPLDVQQPFMQLVVLQLPVAPPPVPPPVAPPPVPPPAPPPVPPPVPPSLVPVMHWPALHTLPGLHAWQVTPSTPQAVLLVPATQLLSASQQPPQLLAVHFAAGGLVVPHEETVANKKPNEAPINQALTIIEDSLCVPQEGPKTLFSQQCVCARLLTSRSEEQGPEDLIFSAQISRLRALFKRG